MKTIQLSILAIALVTALSCGQSGANNRASNAKTSTPVIKKGVTPIADAEIATIEMENQGAYGNIKIELYSNIAPKMVERFKLLAKQGVYDGVTFHRINEEVIQSGDPLSKNDNPFDDGSGESDEPNVEAEFSDIPFDTGIVGAARGMDNNSANSQFFITLKRVPGFDNRYTIYGKVIEGMNNVRVIAGVQQKDGERPLDPIRIRHISIGPR